MSKSNEALTVLVVEDNPDNATMIIRILESANYIVHHSTEGLEAMHMARRLRPHIILMDFDLPDINGKNLVLVLKKQLPQSVVIAVTASVGPHQRRIAQGFGCDDYLAKPFEPDDLLSIIQKNLEKNGRVS